MTRSGRKRLTAAILAILAGAAILGPLGCGATFERRVPIGERFPRVSGKSLSGEVRTFPDDALGEPVLLLIGFEQNTQFDIDRWLLGLAQSGATVRAFELPTIPGMGPRLVASQIDGGMRKGIPEEDWGAVVTLYGDADRVTRFTGNENPLPARVLLLDRAGTVVYFHDRGYSPSHLVRLLETLGRLPAVQDDPGDGT